MKTIIMVTASIFFLSGCAADKALKAEYEKIQAELDAETAREKEQLANETSEQKEQRRVVSEQKKALEEATEKEEKAKLALRKKDYDICNYEAVKATASGQRGYTVYSTIFNDVGDTFRQAELINLCMKSKGYS